MTLTRRLAPLATALAALAAATLLAGRSSVLLGLPSILAPIFMTALVTPLAASVLALTRVSARLRRWTAALLFSAAVLGGAQAWSERMRSESAQRLALEAAVADLLEAAARDDDIDPWRYDGVQSADVLRCAGWLGASITELAADSRGRDVRLQGLSLFRARAPANATELAQVRQEAELLWQITHEASAARLALLSDSEQRLAKLTKQQDPRDLPLAAFRRVVDLRGELVEAPLRELAAAVASWVDFIEMRTSAYTFGRGDIIFQQEEFQAEYRRRTLRWQEAAAAARLGPAAYARAISAMVEALRGHPTPAGPAREAARIAALTPHAPRRRAVDLLPDCDAIALSAPGPWPRCRAE